MSDLDVPSTVSSALADHVRRLAPSLLSGRHLSVPVQPTEGRLVYVEALDPHRLGDLMAEALEATGYAIAEDEDGRTYLALRDPDGWRLLPRVDGLPPVEALVAEVLDLLGDPPEVDAEDVRALAVARSWRGTRDAFPGSPFWPTYRRHVARIAIEGLQDNGPSVWKEDARLGWRPGPRGPHRRTVDNADRAAFHLDAFVGSVPPGRHARAEVLRQYAEAADRSGIPPRFRRSGRQVTAAVEAVAAKRRTSSGVVLERPDPGAAVPLDADARAALVTFHARRATRAAEGDEATG